MGGELQKKNKSKKFWQKGKWCIYTHLYTHLCPSLTKINKKIFSTYMLPYISPVGKKSLATKNFKKKKSYMTTTNDTRKK